MESLKSRAIILGLCILTALLFLLPTMFREEFSGVTWVSKPITLGLDLRGGVHLVYEVKAEEAVKSRLQTIANSVRSDLRDAKIPLVRARAIESNRIEFVLLNDAAAERAQPKIQEINRDIQFLEKSADGERVKLTYGVTDTYVQSVKQEAIVQAVETLRNRVDQFGVTEPLIQRVGERRILLQMPGERNVNAVKKVVGNVAKLEFRLVPLPGAHERTVKLKDKSGASIEVEDEALMTGEAVANARVDFEKTGAAVSLTLNSEGARTFRKITAENVGRSLAIILDNVLYSSPRINEAIGGGQASISGGFTVEEARELALVLRAGALPAPLEVVEERSVGPSLGAESIRKGITAIFVGFVAIALFMVYWYRKAGLVANASLALNLLLVVAILSAFGATLTLPGLAALALTVGVAVDSNVIIFERIKDETANGSSRDAAVRSGFDKAYSAILDSNLTALFSGIILYVLGTGPVKGFAVTLCVGVVTTMFCAVFASKIAFDYFELRKQDGSLSI